MNFRTWTGVLLSAAIGAAGTFASTLVVGGLYLLSLRRSTRLLTAERIAQEKEWIRIEAEARRQYADELRAQVEAANPLPIVERQRTPA